MAEKTKNTLNSSSKKTAKQNNPERKKQIFAILLMMVGLLAGASIVSYANADESTIERLTLLDVLRIPFDDQVKLQASLIHNHLGLLGAIVADFFVNSTFGFASFIFPILMLLWGWIVLGKKDYRQPLTFTNYSFVFVLLASSSLGILHLIGAEINKEWFGLIGGFAADVMTKLLGLFGSSVVVLTALFLTTILAIDHDIHKSIQRFRELWIKTRLWLADRKEQRSIDNSETEVTIQKLDDEPEVKYQPEPEAINHNGEEPSIFREEEREEETPVDIPISVKPVPVERETRVEEIPKPAENETEEIDYVFPSADLLDAPRQVDTVADDELKANAELVRAKLANFGVEIESVSVTPGPVIT